MSHYKPYPAYKESGIEWIGKLPEHWQVAPIKAISTTLNGATPESAKAEYWDGDIAWYTPTDIDNEIAKELGAPRRYISQAGFDSCAVKLAPAGSVVLSTRAPIGSVGITLIPSTINQGCRTLVPAQLMSGKFVASVLVAARDELRLRGNGTTFQELSTDSLRSLRVPLPPASERKRITDHLDRETARIDALIAKKTEFIELLTKKRQALITHAVTKGLNPKAKMKDSGVEWIGEVPEHWQVRPVKSLATGAATLFIDGDWIESKNLADSGIRYITTGNVGEGKYKEQGSGFISEATFDELRCTEVLPGDVLISRLNPPIGRACIAPDLKSRVVTSVDNVILRPSAEFDSMFIVFRFSATDYFHEMSLLGSGATMQRVSRTELGNVRVAWPPLNEQIEISRYIQTETMQIDTLSERVGTSIDLLKKRRSALITAAVTGQIDLRESA